MRTSLRLALAGFVLILLLGAAAWWYLFGPATVATSQLVPGNTVMFLTIPNAAQVMSGYETSQLKQLVESPNVKPLIDSVVNLIGEKNRDLIIAFLPNLSGQSFIAITHLDPDKPEQIGFIAGMKPKLGMNNFDAFVEKLKATYPDVIKEGTTGTGNVAGVDYQWIKGPGAPDKICVAKIRGWIVISWGEASLQDWLERLQGKSTTPSLAMNPDYQKSLDRVGHDSMGLAYLDYKGFLPLFQKHLEKTNPAASDYFAKKVKDVGAMAIGTRFENGEIADRFSVLMPHQAQVDAGMIASPCPFDTLKFTGPDTRLYWASSVNWQRAWKNMQEQSTLSPQPNPFLASWFTSLQTWAQSQGLDVQHNIIDPLGPEFSIQVEWPAETPYPEAGLFVKLDKPDDFKPTINAIIETVRKNYEISAVVNEINSNGQKLAALKFINPIPISPTITEDGPYLGVFLTENQAARSFMRDETVNLTHNADFIRQIGDKRNGASQIFFLDSPQLLDRGYRTVQPYLSLASMFNKNLAAMLKDRNLPPDLAWLAPIGTWSFVVSPDNEGVKAYSASGIGNQGILLAFMGGATMSALHFAEHPISQAPSNPNPTTPPSSTSAGSPAPADSTDQTPQPSPVPTPSVAPDTATNAAPSPTSPPAATSAPAPNTNSTPDATTPTPTPSPAPTQ